HPARHVEPSGPHAHLEASQRRVLNSLLSSARVNRLVEQEALDGAAAYQAVDFLADVRRGSWSEIYNDPAPVVDAYRRNLQRAYIETLADRVNGRTAAADDVRAFFRGELKTLEADLKGSGAKATDRATRMHIDDVLNQIAHALDPAIRGTAAGTPGAGPGTGADEFDVTVAPDSCWVDYAIRSKNGGR